MKLLNIFLCTLFFSALAPSLDAVQQQLIIVRHGEAGNNVEKVYNSNPENRNYKPYYLTDAGIQTVTKTAKDLKAQGFNNDNIIAVFVSPLPRTKQTADILVKAGLASKDKIILDKRIIELNAGDLEGKPTLPAWKPSFAEDYHAESEDQVKDRVNDFLVSIKRQYPEGNIIVVTHALASQDLIDLLTHQAAKLNPGEAKVVPLRE